MTRRGMTTKLGIGYNSVTVQYGTYCVVIPYFYNITLQYTVISFLVFQEGFSHQISVYSHIPTISRCSGFHYQNGTETGDTFIYCRGTE